MIRERNRYKPHSWKWTHEVFLESATKEDLGELHNKHKDSKLRMQRDLLLISTGLLAFTVSFLILGIDHVLSQILGVISLFFLLPGVVQVIYERRKSKWILNRILEERYQRAAQENNKSP
jgi:hypothetical protein